MFFDTPTRIAVSNLSTKMNVDPNALLAVAEVESGGNVYALVKGKKEPLIRWEGHYFYARLKGDDRAKAVAQGLASPKAQAIKNPRSQAGRWDILNRAILINAQAALESVSWGLGQVMGAHWLKLGFSSVANMVNACRSGAAGQIAVMAAYVVKFALLDELQRLDFAGFARGYNGPNYRKYAYDKKIAAAYARMSGGPAVSAATTMLRMGSRGARVRDLQALLIRAGASIKVDGDFGPSTKEAVRNFQQQQGIAADGVVGPETMRRLDAMRQEPNEQPGMQSFADIPQVKGGVAAGVGGGVALESASQLVQQVSDKVSYIPGLEKIGAGLTLLAGALILAGMAYAAYGWWKSGHTDEGDAFA